MRLLVVENDHDDLDALRDGLEEIVDLEIEIAESRDSAIARLRANSFDLVICDLRIPPQDGGLDEAVEHGFAVVAEVRQSAPGTPVLILSAFGTLDSITPVVRDAPHEDVFGSNHAISLTDFVSKGRLPDAIARAKAYAAETATLGLVEVAVLEGRALTPYEKRVLKIFARRLDGRVVRVRELGGGFSSAKTLQVSVMDARGATRALAVGKIAAIDVVDDERRRFQDHVNPIIALGAFTPHIGDVRAGASALGGVFYKLAAGYDASLYDVLSLNPARAAVLVTSVRRIEEPWRDGALIHEIRVRDLRRAAIDDSEMPAIRGRLEGIPWERFEEQALTIRQCCQHGDLHGLNVLVDAGDRPLLIDYGEVGISAASEDAVTLELSLLYHPYGRRVVTDWPTPDEARRWGEIDRYAEGCPVQPFVRACRQWALEVSAGMREVCTNAYAYSTRQLKYNDTNVDVARAVIQSAIEVFERT